MKRTKWAIYASTRVTGSRIVLLPWSRPFPRTFPTPRCGTRARSRRPARQSARNICLPRFQFEWVSVVVVLTGLGVVVFSVVVVVVTGAGAIVSAVVVVVLLVGSAFFSFTVVQAESNKREAARHSRTEYFIDAFVVGVITLPGEITPSVDRIQWGVTRTALGTPVPFSRSPATLTAPASHDWVQPPQNARASTTVAPGLSLFTSCTPLPVRLPSWGPFARLHRAIVAHSSSEPAPCRYVPVGRRFRAAIKAGQRIRS